MQHVTLDRRPHRPARGLAFLGDLTLTPARVHEFCGPARQTLAMMVAGANEGPVFWIAPGWGTSRLHGPGMVPFADPARFIFVQVDRAEDVLWALQETLRAGVVPLVVGEMDKPPALTPIRRLHLAAETGTQLSGRAPTALLLTPDGGAQGVESRWHMAPDHWPDPDRWVLSRQRARSDPPRHWSVRPQGNGFALTPPRSERP